MRKNKDRYYMEVAQVAASMSTCSRLAVGCVFVDTNGYIVAVGYNGTPRGLPNCVEKLCFPGATELPSGSSSSQFGGLCGAVHAEQNCLMQCKFLTEVVAVYCTTEPCKACTRMLINTGARDIFYLDKYPENGSAIWVTRGKWTRLEK